MEIYKRYRLAESGECCWHGRLLLNLTLLMLDEPTNHLDLEAIEWLEKFLIKLARDTLLFVTHDRGFFGE
jgi:ATPase subunit of ABC transporter with duplicated ATPase domains